MQIKLNTIFTPYGKNTIIKPKHPIWVLENTGNYYFQINKLILVQPKEKFGIDLTNLVLPIIENALQQNPKENIKLVNETQFEITFSPATGAYNNGIPDRQALLIETSIEIIR